MTIALMSSFLFLLCVPSLLGSRAQHAEPARTVEGQDIGSSTALEVAYRASIAAPACDPGTYTPDGRTCVDSQRGNFSTMTGATQGTTCPAGYWTGRSPGLSLGTCRPIAADAIALAIAVPAVVWLVVVCCWNLAYLRDYMNGKHDKAHFRFLVSALITALSYICNILWYLLMTFTGADGMITWITGFAVTFAHLTTVIVMYLHQFIQRGRRPQPEGEERWFDCRLRCSVDFDTSLYELIRIVLVIGYGCVMPILCAFASAGQFLVYAPRGSFPVYRVTVENNLLALLLSLLYPEQEVTIREELVLRLNKVRWNVALLHYIPVLGIQLHAVLVSSSLHTFTIFCLALSVAVVIMTVYNLYSVTCPDRRTLNENVDTEASSTVGQPNRSEGRAIHQEDPFRVTASLLSHKPGSYGTATVSGSALEDDSGDPTDV